MATMIISNWCDAPVMEPTHVTKDLAACQLGLNTGLGCSAVEQEQWPCVCTDPGHALDENGCYECNHGKWEMQNGVWVSWYWGDRMMDMEEEESPEEKARKAAARMKADMQREAAAKQFEAAKKKQTTCNGKIACPCKYMCHNGIAGNPAPPSKGWGAGCNIDGCKYIHPNENGWNQAVLEMVQRGRLRMPAVAPVKTVQKPTNRFAGLDDE